MDRFTADSRILTISVHVLIPSYKHVWMCGTEAVNSMTVIGHQSLTHKIYDDKANTVFSLYRCGRLLLPGQCNVTKTSSQSVRTPSSFRRRNTLYLDWDDSLYSFV